MQEQSTFYNLQVFSLNQQMLLLLSFLIYSNEDILLMSSQVEQ